MLTTAQGFNTILRCLSTLITLKNGGLSELNAEVAKVGNDAAQAGRIVWSFAPVLAMIEGGASINRSSAIELSSDGSTIFADSFHSTSRSFFSTSSVLVTFV